MIERRITYAKDKAEVIQRLQSSEESTGPFNLIADVLVFAAALGLKRNRRTRLAEPLAEPIRQSVFERQGYDTMMNLLALHADPRPDVLADTDYAVDSRAKAFEEFANGGLEILAEEIRGAGDVLETVVLMVSAERQMPSGSMESFDLRKLISQ
jgi:dnd system-associated protein 4